ncbi:MAG: amino acid amidase [Gammaproteobacteria bacterium]|nr:MAG: amino acid amidase [Gammaproteobacteria bacterium]
MKLYISADIEGIAGITHWDEAGKNMPEYQEFREYMTREVVAACEGALNANVADILIKDAHGSGRNIIASQLPECARLIRGWSGHPFNMLQQIDQTFDATILTGYHSKAGSETNPLAHCFRGYIDYIKLNGELASEFLFNAYVSALVNVPVVFVSGDKGICEDVKMFNENISTLAVSEGIGASTISITPDLACKKIRAGVEKALKQDFSSCRIDLPENFEIEIKFKDPVSAYKASFYPGMKTGDSQAVIFETRDYFEVMRMLLFVI